MMNRSAEISPCGKYRYRLSRWWGEGPRVVWLMMNPSTADANQEDPTIRKCIGFTARFGFMGFDVVNLFAYRSSDPAGLLTISDPIGWHNARHTADAVDKASLLICAWGCESTYAKMQKAGWNSLAMLGAIRKVRPNLPIECLGLSPSGNPYHPLMLSYSTQRIPFEVNAGGA